MIHSFLLIGQSNAAGRGFLEEAAPLDHCNGRLKVLRNGLWLNMFRPVNPDRSFSGTCLAESFAKEYAMAHPLCEVGIIPCADGGTTISQWQPGEILFDNALNCARLAMRTSTLKGILWHQGEGDCSAEKCELYRERFERLMDTLRCELGMPDLPILVGALGDYLLKRLESPNLGAHYQSINAVLRSIGNEYHQCAFVGAEGLGSNPDNLHFSAEALHEFGIRYYQAYRPFDEADPSNTEGVPSSTERSTMELL